jgi:ribosomal protein S18 acetylase RimI-like enzyme
MPDVRLLEECCLNAWPAPRTLLVGGWVVRIGGGYTKRANSASALSPRGPFAPVLEAAERLYAAHGQEPIFRITPLAPAYADRELAAEGYRVHDPVRVLARPIGPPERSAAGALRIDRAPTEAWLAGSAAANGVPWPLREAHDELHRLITPPAAFATLTVDGPAAGFGVAVLDRDIVGLFGLVVRPEFRGRGLGAALTQGLASWGAANGATSAYLQVMEANAPARELYAKLGFSEAYRYHYRVRPPA